MVEQILLNILPKVRSMEACSTSCLFSTCDIGTAVFLKGMPNYSVFRNNVTHRQNNDDHHWKSTMENRLNTLYTEFKNTNSQIGELLAIVKTGLVESLQDTITPSVGRVQAGCAYHAQGDETCEPGTYPTVTFYSTSSMLKARDVEPRSLMHCQGLLHSFPV
jgi:hypothetical protein